MIVISLDWAHKTDKTYFYNGVKATTKAPEASEGLVIVCENIPAKYTREFLGKGVKVLRVHQNLVAKYRESKGIEKSDEGDAKLIYEYYKEHPENFKEWHGDPKLKTMYNTFKELQKVRVATSNRLWSDTDEFNKKVLKSMELLEKEIIKGMEQELEKYKIWKWLEGIRGISAATAAGLIAYIKDIKEFDSISNLWSYFGFGVIEGKAPKMKSGETGGYNVKARALVAGIIADNFIKSKSPYKKIYDEEKTKQLAIGYKEGELFAKYGKPYKKGDTKLKLLHAHNRAKRKMVKIFLSHLWLKWRELEGLPMTEPYAIAILKHKDKIQAP